MPIYIHVRNDHMQQISISEACIMYASSQIDKECTCFDLTCNTVESPYNGHFGDNNYQYTGLISELTFIRDSLHFL